ncbi:hypothetical protein Btru_058431 [Bulinus truncatus]|nr:hypothetical protein Btru_058431 [Bulinus truncatus]
MGYQGWMWLYQLVHGGSLWAIKAGCGCIIWSTVKVNELSRLDEAVSVGPRWKFMGYQGWMRLYQLMRPTRQTKFITLHLESFVSLRVQLVQILDVVNNSITKGESWIQGNDEIGTFSQVNQLLEFEMSSCLKQLCLIAGEKEDAIPISQHLVQDSSKKKSPSVKSSDHEIWSLTTVIAAPIADSDLMSQFKKPSGSWECQTCLINNKLDVSRCRVCETPRAGSSIQSPAATNSLTGLFKKHPGNWECDTCMIQNAASALRCVACDSPKLGLKAASVVAKSAEPKSSALTVSPTGGFVFNVPTTTATTFDSDGFKFGNTSTISDSTSTGFQFVYLNR